METLECRAGYTPYKIANVLFVLAAGIGVFFLTHWFMVPGWLPHAAFLLVSQSLLGLKFQSFFTDIAAAAILVVVACLSVLTVVRRRVPDSALLGLALAALALTKIAFFPFVSVVAAGWVLAELVKGSFGRRTVLLVGVMLLAWSAPVGGWMTRNLVLFGDFAVVKPDSGRVQAVIDRRASYNTMRDDEFAAGFWFYSPYKPDLGIPKSSIVRFQTRHVGGFRQHRTRTSNTLIETILADPWQHFRVSALMAWRGVFAQSQLGSRKGAIRPFGIFSLPEELSPSLPETVWRYAHKPWDGKDAYVLWFHEQGTIDAYGENEVREFLDLETVRERADVTLYRVPRPDNFVARGPRISEVLHPGSPGAVPWDEPGGLRFALREALFDSVIFTNSRRAVPALHIEASSLSEVWGLGSWPRPVWKFGALEKTLVNLAGFLALLITPLWFVLKHPGRFEVWFVTLPALYLHAVYSFASHFVPRYAQPEIPLRIWATLLLLCLVAASGRRLGRVLTETRLRRGNRRAHGASGSRAA